MVKVARLAVEVCEQGLKDKGREIAALKMETQGKIQIDELESIVRLKQAEADGQFEDYCTADEQTPEAELAAAMNWACQNGADCSAIQVNQRCYLPNTVKDHASYAFNSYYQNMKHKGGSCYFNGAAILDGLNPSHGSCKFEYRP